MNPLAIDWGSLYLEHGPAIRAILRRHWPAQLSGAFAPEDFLHDAFVEAIARAAAPDLAAPIRNWLARIARRRMVRAFRHHTGDPRWRRRRAWLALRDFAGEESGLTVAWDLWQHLLERAPHDGIRRLLEIRRMGLTIQESAMQAGLSYDRARWALRRLRRDL